MPKPTPTLQTKTHKLTLVPQLGGSVAAWQKYDAATKEWKDIFRPWDGVRMEGEHTANFPIIPWNNRIAGGGFHFNHKFHPMTPNRASVGEIYPLHGDGWLQAWDVTAQSDTEIALTLISKYHNENPYHYRGEQKFTLIGENSYSHSISVTNLGDAALPFGLGYHPWFIRSDAVAIDINLTGIWATDPAINHARTPIKMIAPPPPDYAISRINKSNDKYTNLIDHIYYGWDGSLKLSTKSANIALKYHESDQANRGNYYFHVYLPTHMDVYCLEPVTHLIDGFNRDGTLPEQPPHNGVRVLAPNQSLSITAIWTIEN